METDSNQPIPLKIANRKYTVRRKIGKGSFGELFEGITRTGVPVAIKFEATTTRHPLLFYEAKIYKHLAGEDGIPNLHWYGLDGVWNVMVIDLLGPSLEDIFNGCNQKLPMPFVLQLADQMISRLECIHKKGCLHRDIKPENFLIGHKEGLQKIYLIDFGLVKKFRDPFGRHIPYREGKTLTGTARYASISTHIGIEQSRRDDMEGLAYVLIYFLLGCLPWQGLKACARRSNVDRIMIKKMNTTITDLCHPLPDSFTFFLSYCRCMLFEDRPDYKMLRKRFQEDARRLGNPSFNFFPPFFNQYPCDSINSKPNTTSANLVKQAVKKNRFRPTQESNVKKQNQMVKAAYHSPSPRQTKKVKGWVFLK